MQRRKQRFVEADYYELDWHYEECTDGETVGLSSVWEPETAAVAGSQ